MPAPGWRITPTADPHASALSLRLLKAGLPSITLLREKGAVRRGGGDGPRRLGCPGGEARAVVSVAYIPSVADRTVDVFREPMMFPISHASRSFAEAAQVRLVPDGTRC